jgi:hypothetical protein
MTYAVSSIIILVEFFLMEALAIITSTDSRTLPTLFHVK